MNPFFQDRKWVFVFGYYLEIGRRNDFLTVQCSSTGNMWKRQKNRGTKKAETTTQQFKNQDLTPSTIMTLGDLSIVGLTLDGANQQSARNETLERNGHADDRNDHDQNQDGHVPPLRSPGCVLGCYQQRHGLSFRAREK